MSTETTRIISAAITGYSLPNRVFGRYVGMTEEEWLERYGAITVYALVGEDRVRISFDLQLVHLELVSGPDNLRHDTFNFRAIGRDDPKDTEGWRFEGQLIARSGLEELGSFQAVEPQRQ